MIEENEYDSIYISDDEIEHVYGEVPLLVNNGIPLF
jgi:hypothetical protein